MFAQVVLGFCNGACIFRGRFGRATVGNSSFYFFPLFFGGPSWRRSFSILVPMEGNRDDLILDYRVIYPFSDLRAAPQASSLMTLVGVSARFSQ